MKQSQFDQASAVVYSINRMRTENEILKQTISEMFKNMNSNENVSENLLKNLPKINQIIDDIFATEINYLKGVFEDI